MPIEIEGPDGAVVEFPDGTDQDTIRGVMARRYMRFDRPGDEVRADIGRLKGKQRELALRDWANDYVRRERQAGGVGLAVDDTVRTLARGTFVGPWLDEITARTSGALHGLSGGRLGAPEDETLAYQRARDRAVDDEAPVLSTVGQLAGGLAGGAAALRQGGNIIDRGLKLASGGPLAAWAPRETLAGRMVQGAATGATYGYNAGLGNAEGDFEQRHVAGGVPGAVLGGVLGGAAPPVIQGAGNLIARGAETLSPIGARIGANLDGLRQRLAIRASADGGAPLSGADAAAEQIIANQLARANVTVPQLRARLAEIDEATRLGANSRAQNVIAPVDVDPSLQRLAGAAARQQPEADNIARAFQYTRQTGQPSGLPLPETANLPVRRALAVADDTPTGQFERVRDALARAFQIRDYRHHGVGRSAYETENMIVRRAREEANNLYGQAYRVAEGVDIRAALAPVIQRLAADAAEQPEAVGRAMRQMLRQFSTGSDIVATLQRFQKAKEFSDGLIQKWLKAPEGRNRYVGGVLSRMQQELIEAIDTLPGAGPLYRQAREAFSDEMTLRDALRLGRDVFRDNSEVVVDQYRRLATEGERQMFRVGLLDSLAQQMSRKGRTYDVTQLFQSPRIQEILAEVIPRSTNANAVFANRPERFGQYLASERRMIETRNQTLGNSKTAERLADDEALSGMQSMIEMARSASQNPSMSNLVLRALEAAANRVFGMRADTAAAIARRLYTASPMERETLLSSLERRMGPGRAAQFARVMSEYQQAFQQAGGTGAGIVGQQGQ